MHEVRIAQVEQVECGPHVRKTLQMFLVVVCLGLSDFLNSN